MVEDVVLFRTPEGTENLLAIADKYRGDGSTQAKTEDLSWREGNVNRRLEHALVKGITAFIEEDTEAGASTGRSPPACN